VFDLVGFSRGAAVANEVAWKLNKNGVQVPVEGPHRTSYKTEYPQVRFLGLFDPVFSFPPAVAWAWHDEEIADNVENAAIAYAEDEQRLLFRHSILSPRSCTTSLTTRSFTGRHSDVGGHFDNNQIIARISLKWMIDQASAAGVRMESAGLPTQETALKWIRSGATSPGREETWSGIFNKDWSFNRQVLETSFLLR
jgi:thioesterase domain-containing protein